MVANRADRASLCREKINVQTCKSGPHRWVERWLIRAGGAIAVGALLLAGTVTVSLALKSKSASDGLEACFKECEARIPGPINRGKCKENCNKYSYCNGSDARSPSNRRLCSFHGGVTGLVTRNRR